MITPFKFAILNHACIAMSGTPLNEAEDIKIVAQSLSRNSARPLRRRPRDRNHPDLDLGLNAASPDQCELTARTFLILEIPQWNSSSIDSFAQQKQKHRCDGRPARRWRSSRVGTLKLLRNEALSSRDWQRTPRRLLRARCTINYHR